MLRHVAVTLLALGLAAPAAARPDTYEVDPTAARREAARDLVEIVAESALDPRREGDALVAAATAASLAWEIEPDLGRRLFDAAVRRGEILLASSTTSDAAVAALGTVLAVYSERDSNAAFAAVERLAEAASTGAHAPERAAVLARIAEAVAATHPTIAERFLREAIRGAAASPHTWRAIRALDETTRSRHILRALDALQAQSPTVVDLLGIAETVEIVSFERGPVAGRDVEPLVLRLWLSLAARRLGQIGAELAGARRDGRPHRVDPIELAAAESVGPALLYAVERWFPEGGRGTHAGLSEIVRTAPYDRTREVIVAAAIPPSDRALLQRAFGAAERGLERDAREAIAGIESPALRAQAGDEVSIVLAARGFANSDWVWAATRLARIERPELKVRAYGLVARLLAERGQHELAAELAADAVRYGAKAPKTLTTVAGLLDASIALGLSGNGARASEALADALRVYDREGEGVEPDERICACGQFVETRFGDVILSGGHAFAVEDLSLVRALDGASARDLIGTRLLVDRIETVAKRETVQLALVRALLSL